MNISVILPVEYANGATIDMSRYGFNGTGIVVNSRLGQSSVECHIPDPEDSALDRVFSLARQIFAVTKDEICSGRRFERLLYPRIAITRALLKYGGRTHDDVKEILRRDRTSIYHYVERYDCVDFMEKSLREKMYEFDKQAKLILTDY